MPWTGGVNTSVDPGVLDAQELVQADNVQFSDSGARIKREALSYIENGISTPDTRSSSGTVRTLIWNTLNTTFPTDQRIVVGELINVTGHEGYNITSAPVLSVSIVSDTTVITYDTGSILTESTTAAGLTVTRASQVIMVKDFWYFDGAANTQTLIYATNNFQLFAVDSSGRRTQINGQVQQSTIVVTDATGITTGHYFLLNSPNGTDDVYVWYNKNGGGGDPAVSGRTGIEVVVTTGDSSTTVAFNSANAINTYGFPNATYFAANAGANLTVFNHKAGITSPTIDVNTGFSITTVNFGATAPIDAVSTIRTNVLNERLQIYFSGIGNYPIIYDPQRSLTTYYLMGTNDTDGLSMPDASFAFNFLSRVWANDKNSPDLLHFSETFDETLWLGIGDSGAIPIFQGDGDPEGITNAFEYKGLVMVAKKDAKFRMSGDSPENFVVERVSQGIGNEGSLAVAVDEQDVVFVSRRGVHSQGVTDAYGDTQAAFLSADIKPTFNSWNPNKLNLMQGAYIPEINSVALSVAESGKSSANAVWLYNTIIQAPGKQRPGAWYRWPNISCTALSRRLTSGKHKLVLGTIDGRLVQAQTEGVFSDFGTTGIPFTIKTGAIYPGDDPQSIKAFKKITMIYRPRGDFSFTVTAKVDNAATQTFTFNQASGLDLLGTTFVLGTSTLGSSVVLAPFTFTMEGYGRGVTLTVTQPTAEEQIEVWGFVIEYENVDLEQETH